MIILKIKILVMKSINKLKSHLTKKITLMLFFITQSVFFLGFSAICPLNIIFPILLFIISISNLFKNKKVLFFSDLLLLIFTIIYIPVCFFAWILIGLDNLLTPILLIFCIIDLLIVSKNLYLLYKYKYDNDFS